MVIRYLIRLTLCFTLLSAPVITCSGQERGQQEEPLAVIVGKPTSYRTVGKAEISYFAEQGFTEVRAELGTVYKGQRRWINMSALFKVAGKDIVRPDEVVLGLLPYTSKKEVEALSRFSVEVDGEQISFLSFTRGDVQHAIDEKRYIRDLDAHLTLSQFERIARGDQVKVQVGETVFQLSRKQREGLRDMLKAINSPAQSSVRD